MRVVLSLLGVLVPALALATPPAAGPALPSMDAPPGVPACQTLPPDAEFRHYTGYGISGSEVQALQAARGDAMEIARAALCTGPVGKRRCEEIVGRLAQLDEQVAYVRKGYQRRERWRACFTLQISRSYADMEYLERELQGELRQLGMRIQQDSGRESLRVEPPVWADSQCSVGAVGETLIGELAGAFRPAGLTVGDSDVAGSSLRVLLARRADRIDLITTHVSADGSEARYEPVSFIPELYSLEEQTEASCRWDQELGLVEGHLLGRDDLSVRIAVPGNTGEYCEGDRMEPQVVVNRPAHVRIFSVERDGTALLIWPYLPTQDDLVAHTMSLGQAQVQRPKVGEERLVALALPEDADFGDWADWRACTWPSAFDATAFPDGAAVGSVGFLVAPEATDGCPADVTLVPIPELPTCGG